MSHMGVFRAVNKKVATATTGTSTSSLFWTSKFLVSSPPPSAETLLKDDAYYAPMVRSTVLLQPYHVSASSSHHYRTSDSKPNPQSMRMMSKALTTTRPISFVPVEPRKSWKKITLGDSPSWKHCPFIYNCGPTFAAPCTCFTFGAILQTAVAAASQQLAQRRTACQVQTAMQGQLPTSIRIGFA